MDVLTLEEEVEFSLSLDNALKDLINENALSRIYSHNVRHDCGALTAFRTARNCGTLEPFTRPENQKRNKSLLAKIMSLGYGATKLVGQYPEGGKTTKELSFFVVDIKDTGNLLRDLMKLGEVFEQDSILFVPKGTVNNESKAFLIGTNRCSNNFLSFGQKMPFEGGKFGKTSKIYTSYVGGRPFIFEQFVETVARPASGMGLWAMHNAAKLDWTEL